MIQMDDVGPVNDSIAILGAGAGQKQLFTEYRHYGNHCVGIMSVAFFY
jgi:hypothetical protein